MVRSKELDKSRMRRHATFIRRGNVLCRLRRSLKARLASSKASTWPAIGLCCSELLWSPMPRSVLSRTGAQLIRHKALLEPWLHHGVRRWTEYLTLRIALLGASSYLREHSHKSLQSRHGCLCGKGVQVVSPLLCMVQAHDQ